MAEHVIDFGIFEECLRWDAAPVEAGAARAVRLDAGDFFSKLGSADSGDVAGRAATDDNEIVSHKGNK